MTSEEVDNYYEALAAENSGDIQFEDFVAQAEQRRAIFMVGAYIGLGIGAFIIVLSRYL